MNVRTKIVLTDTFCVNLLMLNMYIVHGDLDWIVNERVSGYGENVTLFCVVDDCCKKAAGWIKFDPNYTTIFLDVRDFKYKTSKEDKYAATTNSTGFGLVIKNVQEDDFNIKYLCSYGFEKSSQKVLFQSDAFIVESKLSLVGIVFGSITAVVILLVVTVVTVKWWRKKNVQQNESRTGTNFAGQAVSRTVESKSELLQDDDKDSHTVIQNESEGIVTGHIVEKSESKD